MRPQIVPKNPQLEGQIVHWNNQAWAWWPNKQKWCLVKQPTSLQTFNEPHLEMARQLNRPSPSESATMYHTGYRKQGNDGRMWQVTQNSAGVQRWVPSGGPRPLTVTQQTIKQQPFNMAKATKSITKKTTQEVRNIETSLINKEEVFKMLALAEATGLPLLLVGEPGVNSK